MQDDWEGGKISNAQLESVAYAMQRFKADPLPGGSKPGFFLGDGAGAKAVTVQAVWHRSLQVLALFCSTTQFGKSSARSQTPASCLPAAARMCKLVYAIAIAMSMWPSEAAHLYRQPCFQCV